MNILAWLVLIPIIEFAYIESGNINGYYHPENSLEITVGTEAVILDTVYIKGGATTYQKYIKPDRYAPYLTDYKIEAGVRYNGIEIGYYHDCQHGVVSSAGPARVYGGNTKFFIRYGGKL